MGIEAGTALLIGSLAAAGGSVASAAMMGGDGASFAPRNLYQEITDTVRAQEQTAGKTFALESEYQPRYQQLGLSNLRGLLLGTENGERLEYYNDYTQPYQAPTGNYVNPQTGQVITQAQYNNMLQGNRMVYQPEYRTEGGYNTTRSRMVPSEASPGLLDLMREILPEVDAFTQESSDRQRLNEAESIAKVGPEYLKALRAVNPDQTLLRDVLFGQAQEEVTNPELTPFERRQFQQSYRDAARGRLGDTGQAGSAAESFYMQDRSYDRKKAGQDFATRMIGMDQALYGDPMLQITGRSGGSVPIAGSFLSQGQSVGSGAGPQYFGPNAYSEDLYNSNFNGQNSANIASANRQAGLIGGGMNMFSSLLGGALQGGLFNKKPAGA